MVFCPLIALLLLLSCSSNLTEQDIAQSQTEGLFENKQSPLLMNLYKCNDSIMSTMVSSRSWKKFVRVSLADVWGAYVGGSKGKKYGSIIGTLLGSPITGGTFGAAVGAIGWGSFMSYKAYHHRSSGCGYTDVINNMSNDLISDNISPYIFDDNYQLANVNSLYSHGILLDSLTLNKVHLDSTALAIGQAHNVTLALTMHTLSDSTVLQVNNIRHVPSLHYQNYNITVKDIDNICLSKDFYQACQSASDSIENGEIDHDSKASMVINLFNEVFQYASSDSDVVSLINRYKEIIEKSTELSPEEKQWIYNGLATSIYSYNFWEKNDKN